MDKHSNSTQISLFGARTKLLRRSNKIKSIKGNGFWMWLAMFLTDSTNGFRRAFREIFTMNL